VGSALRAAADTHTVGFFDAGVGRFFVSPGFGGLAALVAAILATIIGWRKLNSDRDLS
jgi:hypothetical protein